MDNRKKIWRSLLLQILLLCSVLIVTATIAGETSTSAFGRYHALVIGNQEYEHLDDLQTPISDAKEVASILEKKYGFNVRLLLNTKRDVIMRVLVELRKKMTDQDNLLIYYAGHGFLDQKLTDRGKSQGGNCKELKGEENKLYCEDLESYWQPIDAEANDNTYWISSSEIINFLKAIDSKHVLIVADSCFSGGLLMRDSEADLNRHDRNISRDTLLRRMRERKSRNALTSGAKETVRDSGGKGHSIFAEAFIDALQENQGILESRSLLDKIVEPVVANSHQTPLYGPIQMVGHKYGDFLFVPKTLQDAELKESSSVAKETDSTRGDHGAGLQNQASGDQGLSFLKRSNETDTSSSLTKQPAEQSSAPPAKKEEPSVATDPKQGDIMKDETTGMMLVYIPDGCFMMGSPESEKDGYKNEGPVHEVCVDAFWMGKHEVTQGQWKKIMGSNPAESQQGDEYPVERVSWHDVQDFIKKLNSSTGRSYRLPTEAEWEYACRAGGTGKYCGGNELDAVAWHGGNSGGSTHPVGGKQNNAFGLHDMSGNVREWCTDRYDSSYYPSIPKNNPQGPDKGEHRVLRGGCWFNNPMGCRAVTRLNGPPEARSVFIGFRLVLPVQRGGR